MARVWALDGVHDWNYIGRSIAMAEQKSLEWYEYDKAEEQVEALQSKIDEAIKDLEQFELSVFSRMAIMNEIERYTMYKSDILETMNGGVEDD